VPKYQKGDELTIHLTEEEAKTLSEGGSITITADRPVSEIPSFLRRAHGEPTPGAERRGRNWPYW
jgi:TusA-related sulfurtransferase